MNVYPTIESLFDSFKKYEVPANSIEDFLKRFTKYQSHEGRGQEYAQNRIANFKEEFDKYGFCFITHHDSKTGNTVSWYGNNKPVCQTCGDKAMCDQVIYDCPKLSV